MDTDLLDCIAHGTSHTEFLDAFGGDIDKAAKHLAKFYLEQLRELGQTTPDNMAVLVENTKRALTASAAASIMGRKGGASTSTAKRAAVRENGKRGGRPRRWLIRAIEVVGGYQLRAPDGSYPQEGFVHPTKDAAMDAASKLWPSNSVWEGRRVQGGWSIKPDYQD